MITSRNLIVEEPQRQAYPLGLRQPRPLPTPTPTKRTVTIQRTVETPFGSPYANVKLNAIDTQTGETVDSITYSCNAWEVETSTKFVKQAEFAERLRAEGYETIKGER